MEDIDPKIASTFYTLDRFAHRAELLKMLEQNDFVISDRYSLSNFIHRGADFLAKDDQEGLKEFFDWLWDWEFQRA